MKLDTGVFEFLSSADFRVLTAIEMGMKNHHLVEKELIFKIANISPSAVLKALKNVHKFKLIFHEAKKCDGYCLTYRGYDYLVLHTFQKQGLLYKLGSMIGTGKESDVFAAQFFKENIGKPNKNAENDNKNAENDNKTAENDNKNAENDNKNAENDNKNAENDNKNAETDNKNAENDNKTIENDNKPIENLDLNPATTTDAGFILKLHRLGRVSFRSIKNNRDYLGSRTRTNWLYVSRIAAHKEHRFLSALWREGFPVPQPFGVNRHGVAMAKAGGVPLNQVRSLPDPALYCEALVRLAERFAAYGLIHCDLNEFNVLFDESAVDLSEVEALSRKPIMASDCTRTLFGKLGMVVIDVPQMVSVCHQNAAEFFKRDVEGVTRFFKRVFGVEGVKSCCDEGEDGVKALLAEISNKLTFDDFDENEGVDRGSAAGNSKSDVLVDLKRDRKAVDAFTGGVMSKKEIRERLKRDMKKKEVRNRK